ncbi:MAG: hypothetical protein ACI9FR_001419, partial [Cryomorphaceae bacterium]
DIIYDTINRQPKTNGIDYGILTDNTCCYKIRLAHESFA